jgi:nudix-type nucleoside diphosphatase (YffH/AdpP family)
MPEDKVRIVQQQVLSNAYFPLKKVTYEQRRRDGSWQTQTHEVYEAASGAAILLYNNVRRSVLLTRQFRLGARLAGHPGFLIEVAAGVLDGASPEERVRAEVREECGYDIGKVERIMTLFASPGSLTEQVHYFIAEYDPARRCGAGGGKADEGEDIEILELGFDDVFGRLARGEIVDAKTVVLLQYLQLRQMASGPSAPP